jgi:hypothetical protein
MQNLTPFAAAKVANIVLKANGLTIELRPQMMYSYAKRNVIASNYDTRAENEKVEFVGEAFKLWLDKYVARALTGDTTSRTDYDELAKQFM